MAKLNEVIQKLEKIKDEHGDVDLVIYHCFDRKDGLEKIIKVDPKKILFDDHYKDVFIGL
ncbi:MAG: hypothetical protein KAT32_04905 [Candidatus Moranbacteria bacterium]|nr:hypothetical protein [Candidatus Moranbacteria bacterium]